MGGLRTARATGLQNPPASQILTTKRKHLQDFALEEAGRRNRGFGPCGVAPDHEDEVHERYKRPPIRATLI